MGDNVKYSESLLFVEEKVKHWPGITEIVEVLGVYGKNDEAFATAVSNHVLEVCGKGSIKAVGSASDESVNNVEKVLEVGFSIKRKLAQKIPRNKNAEKILARNGLLNGEVDLPGDVGILDCLQVSG